MNVFDVIIVGLGVHGSACAREFAARGWRVLAAECTRADQVTGASQGPLRMVRMADPGRPDLTALAAESVPRWKRLSWSGGKPPFRQACGVFIGGASTGSAFTSGGGHGRQIAGDHPVLAGLAPRGGHDGAVLDSGCGLLTARSSVLALRMEAAALGAELVFAERVALGRVRKAAGSLLAVRVRGEDVLAARVLICAGSRSAELPGWARLPGVRAEPAYMQTAEFRGGIGGLRRDAFYAITAGEERFCIIPFDDEDRLQFGHFAMPEAAAAGPGARLAAVSWEHDIQALREIVPGLGEVARRATIKAAYLMPDSGRFVLGWVAPHVGTLVACSGIGFKFAPAVAARVVSAFEGSDRAAAGLSIEDYT